MQRWRIERAEERRRLNQSRTEAKCLYCGFTFTFIPIFPGVSQPFDTITCRRLWEEENQSNSRDRIGGDIG